MIQTKRTLLALAFVAALGGAPLARSEPASRPGWTGAWASAQMIPDGGNALAPGDLDDATLRQIVRLSGGGPKVRVRLSNLFGSTPLRVTAVRLARAISPDSARIDPASDRAATFAGRPDVIVPPGAEYWSDPVDLPVVAPTDLAVSVHVERGPDRQTSHPGARATSYLVKGARAADPDLVDARKIDRWFALSGVDVAGVDVAGGRRAGAGAIVLLGDSITDGYGVAPNTNGRWPDALATRLRATPDLKGLSVLNLGIGGNRLLLDGLGPNAMARFDRDVLGQSGARFLVVLEGVNDLGVLTRDGPATPQAHAELVASVTDAYRQMIDRARARGLKVIGATIMPFAGSAYYHPPAETEADRQAINAWIRQPGNFDAVIDFDRTMRDPARPDRLAAAYDSGDGLHPSMAGYQAMADLVPLEIFR